ncbi:MAG: hypothetical protein K6T34_04705 [Thermoflavifilum sp.]|nr:hypothetical protein [Thermoflavifilum sp.]
MNFPNHQWVACLLMGCLLQASTAVAVPTALRAFTIIQQKTDTVPPRSQAGFFHKIGQQVDSLMSRHYRDSLLNKLTRAHEPPPASSPTPQLTLREQAFRPYQGRIIRHISFVQVPVFGPRSLNDTSYRPIRLINIANSLHTPTRLRFIRRALFFQPRQRVDARLFADNERYLRSLPVIEDAQFKLIPVGQDSVDVQVITKDLFEFGGNIAQLDPTKFQGNAFNKNLFGTGKGIELGAAWNHDYFPRWYTEWMYSDYNIGHSYANLVAGFSQLNDQSALDTGLYEQAAFLQLSRPLYSTTARFTGGLEMAWHQSMNIHRLPDSLFRDYQYGIVDAWAGYHLPRELGTSTHALQMALLLRQYNIFFTRKPTQPTLATDPFYNNRRYLLGQLVLYRQHYVVTQRLFGFGRTEDIPIGVQFSLSGAIERYVGLRRKYTAVGGEAFLVTPLHGLWHGQLELGSFWHKGSQDAIIHASGDYYSSYVSLGRGGWRIFAGADWLSSPNPYFNKPLNINGSHGITGYRYTTINGYQRLNVYLRYTYYAPFRFYGFGFHVYALLQGSSLNNTNGENNQFYQGYTIGAEIRNENLPINTLQLSASYFPAAPSGVKTWFLQITTISDFRFNVFSLRAPALLEFQ